jgi:hypothetical protein
MGQYPGAAWAGVSPNKSKRNNKVRLFIIHHYASTQSPDAARKRFMAANDRSVSPNYQVNADGSVFEIVPPDKYRAWTTGAVDHQAVTCETQNTSGAPAWGISRESEEAIAHLVAWASRRYGFPIQRGRVTGTSSYNTVEVPGIVGHNETPAGRRTSTACPGPSMDIAWIISRAKQIAAGQAGAAPRPSVPKPSTSTPPAPGKLVVDGDLGTATIRALQEALGTHPDGVISRPKSAMVAELQRRLNAKGARDWQGREFVVDGVGLRSNHTARVPLAGRWRTIWALQDYLGTTKDGALSRRRSEVIKELQRRLNAGTLGL